MCNSCGRVFDIPTEYYEACLKVLPSEMIDFEVNSFELTIKGNLSRLQKKTSIDKFYLFGVLE